MPNRSFSPFADRTLRLASSGRKYTRIFLLLRSNLLAIIALTSKGGMIMPFWTQFWVIVPPIVLLAITIIFYIVSGKKREG